jgi:ankyrin repeat protein
MAFCTSRYGEVSDVLDRPVSDREAFLLVYSVSSRSSLSRLHSSFQSFCESQRIWRSATHPIGLIGNKPYGTNRVVSPAEGLKYAFRLGVDCFVESSDESSVDARRAYSDIITFLSLELWDDNSPRWYDSKLGQPINPTDEATSSAMAEDSSSVERGRLSMCLAQAARANNFRDATRLLDAGADINSQLIPFGYKQHVVEDRRYPGLIQLLLERLKRVAQKNSEAEVGSITTYVCDSSALHEAAIGGHLEMVKLLLQKGANLNQESALRGTPLQAAASRGLSNVVACLLQEGANPNVKAGPFAYPLHAGAWSGSVEVVHALLNGGADISAVDDDGCTALHIAASIGEVGAATVLLERGPRLLVNTRTKRGETPLDLAEECESIKAIEILVQFGGIKAAQLQDDQESTGKGSEERDMDAQLPGALSVSDILSRRTGRVNFTLPRNVSLLQTSPRRWTAHGTLASRLINSILTWAKSRSRPRLKPGYQRLEWIYVSLSSCSGNLADGTLS